MNTANIKAYLLSVLLSLIMFGCSNSDDSEDDNMNQEGVDLIIGEWLYQSENDYECGTHNVVNERLASDNESVGTRVFTVEGTYQNFDDGVLDEAEDQMGTWEYLGEGIYRMNYTVFGDPRSWSFEIEFLDNGNTMRFGVDDECFEGNDGDIYSYTVWTRQ